MPAISSRETIPNFPLNGHELAIYAVKVFEQECELRDVLCVVREPAVRAFKQALENDWVFKPSFIYRDVSFEVAFQSHVIRNHETRCAFTLQPTFHFPTNPSYPISEPFVRRPVSCTAPPIEGFSPEAEHVVDCFTLAVKVTNPNLVRVHLGMPIKLAEKVEPKHGQLFGEIKNHEVTYDPKDFEALPEPVVTEQSAKFAEQWGLRGIALLHVIADSTHQPIDEQELVAHVDSPEAEQLLVSGNPQFDRAILEGVTRIGNDTQAEMIAAEAQFDRTLREGINPDWDGTVLGVDGQRVSLLESQKQPGDPKAENPAKKQRRHK